MKTHMNDIQKLYYELEHFYNFNFEKYQLKNRFFCRNGNKITWHQYESHISNASYIEEYQRIIDNNQYSFMIGNEHCIQLYYEYNNGLHKANLAFYPNIDDDLNETDYLRFDCDISTHRDYIHTSYHAHFGYNSNSRVSIYRFPTPIEFMNFIIIQYFNNLITDFEKMQRKEISPILTLENLGHKYLSLLKI